MISMTKKPFQGNKTTVRDRVIVPESENRSVALDNFIQANHNYPSSKWHKLLQACIFWYHILWFVAFFSLSSPFKENVPAVRPHLVFQ